MVKFKIECENAEERKNIRDYIHKALVGSICYIDSDVILSEKEDGVYLFIGDDRKEDNLSIEIARY